MTTSTFLESFFDSGSIISIQSDTLILGAGESQWMTAPPKNYAFFFQDFFLESSTPWRIHSIVKEYTLHQLLSELALFPQAPPHIQWLEEESAKFNAAFDHLETLIFTNVLQKGVPYAFQKGTGRILKEHLCWFLVRILPKLQKNRMHLYGYWEKGCGIIGATPEVLFEMQDASSGSIIKTMALAATTFEGQGSTLNQQKEMKEHAIVVEGLCADLQSVGEVHVGKTTVLPFLSLKHLMTPIQAKLNSRFSFEEIVKLLHPSPALGAFPKTEGAKWLKEDTNLENRGHYGAPIGIQNLSQNISLCYVAIRNMQWREGGVKLGAGCGVIAGSEKQKEWQEIQKKWAAIRELFEI